MRFSNLLALAVGTVAGFAVAELGLRIHFSWVDKDPAQQLARTATSEPPPYSGGCSGAEPQATLGELIRPSRYSDVICELKPHLDTCYHGVRVRTNGEGLRAPTSYRRPKPAGVHRILLLGDSQTFGQGVAYEHTFGRLLEREIARTGSEIEVINTGVDGYNTAQEAAHLLAYGMAYEPNCIVILSTGNGLELPRFLLAPRNERAAGGSYLLEAVRQLWSRRTEADPLIPSHRIASPQAEGRVPPTYRHMVGIRSYRRALRLIADTAGEVPVINFADPEEIVRRETRGLQRQLRIILPEFRTPWRPEVWLSDENRHFNPQGHAELADRMLESMRRQDVCLP